MARPAEFDRSEVIRKATAAFCRTGYTATSISELVKVTNLKPGSLYGAFNSKRGLFLEVLSVYAAERKNIVHARLTSSSSPLDCLRFYFDELLDEIDCSENNPQADLIVKTIVELGAEDEEIRELAKRHLASIEVLIAELLERAIACGELSNDAQPARMAKFIVANIIGIRVTGGTHLSREEFQALIDQMFTVLDIPNKPQQNTTSSCSVTA